MELYGLFGFVGILRETIRILSKNGKLIASITSISIILSSLLFLCSIIFTNTFIHDLLAKGTLLLLSAPMSPGHANLLASVKEESRILFAFSWALLLSTVFLSVFSMAATTLASAMAYSGKALSFKDLMLRLRSSFTRPIVTSFYIVLMGIGCIFLALAFMGSLPLFVDKISTLKVLAIAIGILTLAFLLYLSVVFHLAMAISVIEEGFCGVEAMGKAGGLVKGKRLDGFALNLLFTTALAIANIPYVKMSMGKQSVAIQVIVGLIVTVFCGLVGMFQFMAYTVLYFHCKKIQGEEIELQGSLEYSKLPSVAPAIEDLP